MFMFIVAILLVVLGLGWLIARPSIPKTEERYTSGRYTPDKVAVGTIKLTKLGFIPLVLGLVILALSSFTVVGARNVGVEKFFSATTGRTMDAGFHFIAPWNSVTDVYAGVNAEEYDTEHPIKVKIGDQGEAQVALAYRWRINPAQADVAYKDYNKSEDDIVTAVRKALISTNIKAALNEELGSYNPLQNVQISSNMTPAEISKVAIPPIPYKEFNDAVQRNLQVKIGQLGDLVEVLSVTISYIQLPEGTQTKINEFNTKVQESKNALVDIAIKTAQATANEKLAKSVDKSPNVLVSKCIDGLIDGDITNEPGFSCWGQSSAVVVPSK